MDDHFHQAIVDYRADRDRRTMRDMPVRTDRSGDPYADIIPMRRNGHSVPLQLAMDDVPVPPDDAYANQFLDATQSGQDDDHRADNKRSAGILAALKPLSAVSPVLTRRYLV